MPIKRSKTRIANLKLKRISVLAIVSLIAFCLIAYDLVNPHNKWQEPERFESKDGYLETNLVAGLSEVQIGNHKKVSRVYNDSFPGATYVLKGGDTFEVNLTNNLEEPTNLHFHGSHVSPKGNSDNVLIAVDPGTTFTYEYRLPEDHPPGLYWYHPHLHPYVENQVMGGMAGAIVVKGDIDELPGIKGVPEKLLVLQTQKGKDSNNPIRLVNGMESPTITIRPGEIQRWRILNASADDFFKFAIPGYKLHIISRDGNTLSQVETVDSELLAPGNRVEILIQGKWFNRSDVVSLPFKVGDVMDYKETQKFMTLKTQGLPVFGKKMPTTLIPIEDLKTEEVAKTRILTFGMKKLPSGQEEFLLDGQPFNADIISQVMTLGTVEEWKLVNETEMWHPFHIHINPFQVIAINDKPVNSLGYQDTYGIPPKSTVTIRTKYRDFDGKFVLHCHILYHEDHGMMQVIEVVKPGATVAPHNGLPDMEKMLIHAKMHH